MAIDVEKYQALKRRADKAKSDADRAEGVLEEQMKKLKREFDVDTIEDAEKLLTKLKEEESVAEKKYDAELASFETKWGKLL